MKFSEMDKPSSSLHTPQISVQTLQCMFIVISISCQRLGYIGTVVYGQEYVNDTNIEFF